MPKTRDDRGRIVQLTRYRDRIMSTWLVQKVKHFLLSNKVAEGSSSSKTSNGWKLTEIVPEPNNTIKVRGLKSASFTYRSFKIIYRNYLVWLGHEKQKKRNQKLIFFCLKHLCLSKTKLKSPPMSILSFCKSLMCSAKVLKKFGSSSFGV